jgi:hypothetical protein
MDLNLVKTLPVMDWERDGELFNFNGAGHTISESGQSGSNRW